MKALEGLRVLVVDDEALIALHAEDILLENGAIPVGPASTLSEALVSVENPGIDAVLLDVNLNGQSSKPVAERLSAMAIPYIVVTGYGQLDWDGMKPVVLAKPYDGKAVCQALADVVIAARR